MAEKPILIASDIHLGAAPATVEASFLRWLEWAGAEASRIIINGDLFDFWFEYRSAIPRGHTRVLGKLASIVDRGIPVTLLGGNHDWWGGDYLTTEVGVDFHRESVEMELAGLRAYIAHGDGLGRGDLGYRIMKPVLRSRLAIAGFRWLHPDLGAWLARRVSNTEHRDGPTPKVEARSEALEAWGRRKLAEEPDLDLVVLGHTHVPILSEVAPKKWYVNAGDWLTHRSYLVLTEGSPPRLEYW